MMKGVWKDLSGSSACPLVAADATDEPASLSALLQKVVRFHST